MSLVRLMNVQHLSAWQVIAPQLIGRSVRRHAKSLPQHRRMHLIRRAIHVVSATSLALMASCSSATEPARPRLSFEVLGHLRPPVDLSIGVSEAGVVTVTNFITSPCAPYDANAEVQMDEGVIVLTVTGQATGPCPLDVVDELSYRAELSGITSGAQTFRLVHTYADANWPDVTVVEKTIDVP